MISFSDHMAVAAHVQVSAFLLYGLRKGVMSGLSAQTVMALSVSACLLVVKKFWWKVVNRHDPDITTAWTCQASGFCLSAILLMASLQMLHKKKTSPKEDKGEMEDDFGRKEARYLWFKVFRRSGAPPMYLHWGLIYVGALLLAFTTAWASSSFSLVALYVWAKSRPTAMIALFDNYIRGLLLLPQLHVSQKAGVISSALAFWIALIGAVDFVELASDGIRVTSMCYIIGDFMSMLLVSDFMWIFFKAMWRGKQFVEMQMYEV